MKPEEVTVEKADKFKAYNYIMLMSSGNIKIGLTTDPVQRIKSLNNSNSGGFYIEDICLSPQNYISERVEEYLHWHYHKNRVNGEFFEGLDYNEVRHFFYETFTSRSFLSVNRIRKQFCEEHGMNLSEYKSTHGFNSRATIPKKKEDDEEC